MRVRRTTTPGLSVPPFVSFVPIRGHFTLRFLAHELTRITRMKYRKMGAEKFSLTAANVISSDPLDYAGGLQNVRLPRIPDPSCLPARNGRILVWNCSVKCRSRQFGTFVC